MFFEQETADEMRIGCWSSDVCSSDLAMQASACITEPDYCTLLDDMAFEEGSEIPIDRFINPKVEVELAFILSRPLGGPDVTTRAVFAATEEDLYGDV